MFFEHFYTPISHGEVPGIRCISGQSCPTEYSYLSTLNKCVKVYGHAVKQSDAEYTCSLFGGGHLLSVHNSFQKQQILGDLTEFTTLYRAQ